MSDTNEPLDQDILDLLSTLKRRTFVYERPDGWWVASLAGDDDDEHDAPLPQRLSEALDAL